MSESYWQREAQWCDRWHETSLPSSVDFAVLGGGLSGLATALHIREQAPKASVLLLEAERVGFGASGRNAGFLSPVAAPIWLLGVNRMQDRAWALGQLNRRLHQLADWIAEACPDAEIAAARLSILGESRTSDLALREFARRLARAGLAHDLCESPLGSGRLSLGMDSYTLHPYRLVLGLATRLSRLGVLIRERGAVREVRREGSGLRLHLKSGETATAGRLVVCTNAYGRIRGIDRPRALPLHSYMLATEPQSVARAGFGADFRVHLNAAQHYHREHRSRWLYGGFDTIRDIGLASAEQRLLCGMQALHARPVPPVSQVWSGRLHATPTGLPILRPTGTDARVILNLGYGGTGVLLSLVCAPFAASLATGAVLETNDDHLFSAFANTKLSIVDSAAALMGLASQHWRPQS